MANTEQLSLNCLDHKAHHGAGFCVHYGQKKSPTEVLNKGGVDESSGRVQGLPLWVKSLGDEFILPLKVELCC